MDEGYEVTIRANSLSGLTIKVWDLARRLGNPVPEAEDEPDDISEWEESDIRRLWQELSERAKYVLGVIADYNGTVKKQSVVKHLENNSIGIHYQGGGTGIGGALSSYGFATKALGFRSKEKLYEAQGDEYRMKVQYVPIIDALFTDWITVEKKSKRQRLSTKTGEEQ